VEVAGARAPRASAHHCVICDITTTSAQHMAMHVAGKAHRRRVATGHMPASVAAAAAALAGAGGDAAAAIAAAGDGSSAGYDSGEGSRGRRAAAGAGPGPGADGLPATAGHAAGAPRPPSADSGSSAGGAGGGGHANGYHGAPNGAAADCREAWSAEGPGHRRARPRERRLPARLPPRPAHPQPEPMCRKQSAPACGPVISRLWTDYCCAQPTPWRAPV
jgi:hypothetical protein